MSNIPTYNGLFVPLIYDSAIQVETPSLNGVKNGVCSATYGYVDLNKNDKFDKQSEPEDYITVGHCFRSRLQSLLYPPTP